MHTLCCTFQSLQQRTRLSCLCLILLLFACPSTYASESFTVTTDLYQGFDLATGMTELDPTVITIIIGSGQEIEAISTPSLNPLFDFSPSIDMYFGFSTDVEQPITIIAESLKGMAVFDDTSFDTILNEIMTREVLPTPGPIATLHQDDMVVLVTSDDDFILLGDVRLLPDAQVQFTYQIVAQNLAGETATLPEPGTLLLVGVGMIGLLGIIIRTRKRLQGGTRMKHKKMLLLMILVPLLVDTAFAVQLTVIKVGTGDGIVDGERIFCGSSCTQSFEKKTVVHLKAIPDSESRFIGWMVHGKPQTGVLTIDQEDLIVAARFESIVAPDDLVIQWYNGPHKERALMVLDEVAVFLEPWDTWDISTQNDLNAAVQEITQRFHPQASVSAQYEDYMILLKSPEPVEKDQLAVILANLQELKYVKYASPVLYVDPGAPETQLILTDEITVKFPDTYTHDQIAAIETEYQLERIKSFGYAPNGFVYRVSEPVEALNIANQLHESGLVEFSYPEWIMEYILLNSNDSYFGDQWHLENTGQNGGTPGEDVDILSVWDTAIWNPNTYQGEHIRGSGVVIAIVDDGVEIVHEDLKQNVREDLGYDFIDGDYDPSPAPTKFVVIPSDLSLIPVEALKARHGTAVAGVAAGKRV